jgi:serine/threonine-protein kinase
MIASYQKAGNRTTRIADVVVMMDSLTRPTRRIVRHLDGARDPATIVAQNAPFRPGLLAPRARDLARGGSALLTFVEESNKGMGLEPLVVTLTDTASGESHVEAFARSPIYIGNGDTAALKVRGNQVSARHAKVSFDRDRILFTDLDSRFGTTVDGVMPRVGEEFAITGAEDVRIGRFRLSFSRGPAPPGAVWPAAPALGELERPRVGPADEARDAGTILRGTLLGGRFRILAPLGDARTSVVYRAHDEHLNAPVAIKTLAREGGMRPEFLERFLREAKVIRAVSHPNIVVVHDVDVDGDIPYIAMELLKGEVLRAVVERAAMTAAAAVDVMLGVCAGLHAAHAHGLVHRDLKPGNIFLSQAWRAQDVPKILDFGASKTADSNLTVTGDFVGTVQYLSPEQARQSNAVDARSDIHALGVILYQCVTQKLPHAGDNNAAILKNILDGRVRPLRQMRPDLPAAFAEVVHQAMSLRLRDRFASAHEMARALLPFASARGQRLWSDHFAAPPPADPLATVPPGKAPAREREKESSIGSEPGDDDEFSELPRRRTGILVALAIVVALGVIGAVVFSGGGKEPDPAPLAAPLTPTTRPTPGETPAPVALPPAKAPLPETEVAPPAQPVAQEETPDPEPIAPVAPPATDLEPIAPVAPPEESSAESGAIETDSDGVPVID